MKRIKITKIVSAMALTLCLVMTGCNRGASQPAASSQQSGNSEVSSGTGGSHYPVTVTTYNYACEPIQLTYNKAPERIVSCNQQTTELILELGLVDKVVGTAYMDGLIHPSLAEDYAKTTILSDRYPSKEAVIGSGADFIIGWRTAFEEKALGDVTEWHAMGINTMIPRNANNTVPPNTVDNLLKDIRDLGAIFDIEEVTDAYIADFERRLAAVEARIQRPENPLRVLFITPRDTGEWWIHGNDRLIGDIIRRGGGINLPEATVSASSEDIISMDPDMLFVVKTFTGIANTDEDCYRIMKEHVELSDMRAVKANRIVPVTLEDFVVGNGRTIPAIEAYAKAMYPEKYN